jgi:hypothetical protein
MLQVELLMDIHENEILHLPPKTLAICRSAKRLLKSGYISIEPFVANGKQLMVYFITPFGIQYLHNLL